MSEQPRKIFANYTKFAKEQNIEAEKALAVGVSEKAKVFVASASEIYHGIIPERRHRHR